MAIDSIEHCELSALGKSRLGGMKRFLDDKEVNFVGADNNVYLFGSRKKKKTAYRQEIEDKYNALPTDCANIDVSIEKINSDISILVGRSATARGNEKLKVKEQLDESNKILGEFKSRKILLGCSKAEEKIQEEAQKKESIDLITKLGMSSVEGAKADISKGGGGTKNWIIWGGVGVGVILIAAILIKLNK
jgi:hypothetical protein